MISGGDCALHQPGNRPVYPQVYELLGVRVCHVPDRVSDVWVPLDPVPKGHAEVGARIGEPD